MRKSNRAFGLVLALVLLGSVLSGCGNGSSSSSDSDSTSGTADTSLQDILDQGYLTIGLDDSFPPMGFRDDDYELVGFDIDVAKEVCERMGVEAKFQPIEWIAKEQEINTGNIDCIWNGFSIDEERKEKFNLSAPYMNNNMTFVVSDDEIQSQEDLAGKTIGVQAGSSASLLLDKNEELKASFKEVLEFKDNVMALQDLEAGGVDVVFMDDVVANYYIAENSKGFSVLTDAVKTEQYAVGFRKGEDALTNDLNRILAEMAADGTLKEISEKWFGKDVTIIGK